MPDWAVNTNIGARNGLSGPFARMGASVLGFGRQAGGAFDHAHRRASLFKSLLGANFIGNLAANAVRRLTSEVRQLVTEGLDLASNLVEVQNVVDTTFGAQAAETVNQWSRQAIAAYGLSELQAKQFTGTMGAMLKSSGLAGSEIVKMSEGLVGLAGDFASFYNLEAETAFEKIRSGISGETEPLKQLGINMSVANMQAFALTQGIKKQWAKMAQGEQAQLRYAYLMQASADAQGDFAKTLETSYANQKRVLATNLQQVAASALTAVLPLALKFTTRLNEIVAQVGDWVAANRDLIQQRVEEVVGKITAAVQRFGRWVTDHKAEIVAFWERIKVAAGKVWEFGVGLASAMVTFAAQHKPEIMALWRGLQSVFGWMVDHADTLLKIAVAWTAIKFVAGPIGIATNLIRGLAGAGGAAAATAAAAPAAAAATAGLGPAAQALMGGGAVAAAGGASMAALSAIPVLGAALAVGRSALPMVTQSAKFQHAAKSGEKFEGGGFLTNLFARAAGLAYRIAGEPRETAPNAAAVEGRQRTAAESMRLFNDIRFQVDTRSTPGVSLRIRRAPEAVGATGLQYAGAQ